jgi:uncharacterized protein (UPF0333 family)
MLDKNNTMVQGHIKIWDPLNGEVIHDKSNAIHYENMSEALALSLANKSEGYIQNMVFGNGATSVDTTGVITYLPTNTFGQNASLYNQTYSKVVDNTSVLDLDPIRNYIEVRHTPGLIYTDIFVSCLLDYAEPAGQQAFDNSTTMQGSYVFDELGLTSYGGKLLTHVIFHPVQKALNRLIQIDYTVRIQTLTNLSSNL